MAVVLRMLLALRILQLVFLLSVPGNCQENQARIEEFKIRILRALNLTEAPLMHSSSHRMQRDGFEERVLPSEYNSGWESNGVVVLSEAKDFRRLDTMSFTFDSRLRSVLPHIETALLAIRLRPYLEEMPATDDESEDEDTSTATEFSRELRSHETQSEDRAEKDNKTVMGVSYLLKKIKDEADGYSDNLFDKEDQSKSRQQAESTKACHLTPWQIWLAVKVVDDDSGERHRIGRKKVSVCEKRATVVDMYLPKELLIAAVESSDHTLKLQIRCRHCKQRVQLEGVYKTRRKDRKKGWKKRLNPNRPYLLIKVGSSYTSYKDD